MFRSLLPPLAVAASLLAAAGAGAAVPGIPSSYPGAGLAPIKAMSYQPAPSNYVPGSGIFFDSDFFNDDFNGLWGSANSGRNDLATMAADGVNFLHLYDWNPQRSHLNFLNAAQASGISVAVPISNYFIGQDQADITKIVAEIYTDASGTPSTTPHPAVKMITLGNEYDISNLSAGQVAAAAAAVVQAEQALGATTVLPVAVPVSFGLAGGQVPGVPQTQAVMAAFASQPGLGQSFVSSRFIAATNPQNPGSYLSGPVNGASNYYAAFAAAIPNTPLWFSEMGAGELLSCTGYPSSCTPSLAQQATFNADQFAAAVPGAGGILLGGTQFEFEDEEWKGNPASANDSSFGVYTFPWPAAAGTPSVPTTAPNGASGPYFVDPLAAKPSLASMTDAFTSTWNVTGGSSSGASTRAAGTAIDARHVVQINRDTGKRTTLFDGTAAGLKANNGLAAVTTAPDRKSLLIALQRPARLKGVGVVVRNEVIRYDLRTRRFTKVTRVPGRPIDALAQPVKGGLIVSRTGTSDLEQHTAKGWKTYATAKALGLDGPGEDIDSLWVSPDSGDLYVSTTGKATSGTERIGGDDVIALSHDGDGWHTREVEAASLNGLSGSHLHGFALGG
jgi:hypothetical protein